MEPYYHETHECDVQGNLIFSGMTIPLMPDMTSTEGILDFHVDYCIPNAPYEFSKNNGFESRKSYLFLVSLPWLMVLTKEASNSTPALEVKIKLN